MSQAWMDTDGKIGTKTGVDNNTFIQFPNTTDVDIKTSGGIYNFTQGTLNTPGDITINSGAGANGLTAGNVTASIKVTSSVIEASTAFSASDGATVAIVGPNDLKFDRASNTSYISQLGTEGKIQIGLGTGAVANAAIFISGSNQS